MGIASQTTLIAGIAVFVVGVVVALLGRLMMNSATSGNGGFIEALMAIFGGAGARVGGWLAMAVGVVISIVAGVMHMSGT